MTSLYGLLIELVQRGIPGRSADPVDWLLDTTGALVFLFVFRKYAKSVWNL
jgi:VanZ family protein